MSNSLRHSSPNRLAIVGMGTSCLSILDRVFTQEKEYSEQPIDSLFFEKQAFEFDCLEASQSKYLIHITTTDRTTKFLFDSGGDSVLQVQRSDFTERLIEPKLSENEKLVRKELLLSIRDSCETNPEFGKYLILSFEDLMQNHPTHVKLAKIQPPVTVVEYLNDSCIVTADGEIYTVNEFIHLTTCVNLYKKIMVQSNRVANTKDENTNTVFPVCESDLDTTTIPITIVDGDTRLGSPSQPEVRRMRSDALYNNKSAFTFNRY